MLDTLRFVPTNVLDLSPDRHLFTHARGIYQWKISPCASIAAVKRSPHDTATTPLLLTVSTT